MMRDWSKEDWDLFNELHYEEWKEEEYDDKLGYYQDMECEDCDD